MGVEELAGDFGHAGEGVDPAVNGIARDGAASGGGVNPDLVGATCMKAEFEEACAGPGAENFPIGFGGSAAAADGHALAGDGVAANRALPRAGIAAGATDDKGEVGFFGFAIAKLAAEFAVGGIVFGGDEKASGFPVETMNNARPIGRAARGEFSFAVVEEGGGEGSGGSTRAGVDVHARGLVDDEDVLVLVQNFDGKIFGGDLAREIEGNTDGDGDFGGKRVTPAHRFSSEGDPVLFHPLLDAGAGFAAEAGEGDIRAVVLIERGGHTRPDPFFGRGGAFGQFLGMTDHRYLILPLFSSVVYAAGMIFLKRAMEMGQPPRRVLVGSNLAMGLAFAPLLFWAEWPKAEFPLWMWLGPSLCSILFFLGQVGTFRALAGGDVSVATPVLGSKVVLTAVGSAWLLPGQVPEKFWWGAGLCSLGVALLGGGGGEKGKKGAWRAVGWGVAAAASFSLTDVLVAKVAPQIGLALFGPWMMGGVAMLSVLVLPVWAWGGLGSGQGRGWLGWGVGLIGVQAVALLGGIVISGDPIGVNVVYALRGLWSVGLVVWVGGWVGNREAGLPRRVLGMRAVGAAFLLAAVWAVLA